MTGGTLEGMTDDELIELLAELERAKIEADYS